MEQQVQNQISGSINPEAVKALIGGKVKRNSSKKATEIVKNSVPSSKRKTKITKEQGFRNYLKYTDPLLLNNNEVDKSDIANSLANMLNVFLPKKIETEKMKEVQGYITREEPRDVNDISTEIKNDAVKTIQKNIRRKLNEEDALNNIGYTPQELIRKNIDFKRLQSAVKRSVEQPFYNKMKEAYDINTKTNPAKILQASIRRKNQTDRNEIEKVLNEDMKTQNLLEKMVNVDKATTKLASVVKGRKVRKEVKPFVQIQAARMKKIREENKLDKNTTIGSQVRRKPDGSFDGRALGNKSKAAGKIQRAVRNKLISSSSASMATTQ